MVTNVPPPSQSLSKKILQLDLKALLASCSDSSLTTSSHIPSKAADLSSGGGGTKFAAVNKKPIGRGSKKRRVSDSLARCCHSCCAQGPQRARVVTSLCDGRQQHHRRCFAASKSSSWNLRRSLPGVSYWNAVSPCAASVPATLLRSWLCKRSASRCWCARAEKR